MEEQRFIPQNVLTKIKAFTVEAPTGKGGKTDFVITNNAKAISYIETQIQNFLEDRSDNKCLQRIYLSQLETNGNSYEQIYRIDIRGRQNTHYQFRKITCYIFFPDLYPTKAPVVYFNFLRTKQNKQIKFEHINVFSDGRLCQQIIQSLYHPNLTLSQILEAIQNTLYNQNPNSAANGEMRTLKANDLKKYNEKMRAQSQLLQLDDEEDD